MSSPTDITIRDEDKEFGRHTGDRHVFQLKQFKAVFIEMEDLHFHHDSAVMMPDHERGDEGAEHERITGLAVIAECYRHAEAHPDRKILIAGHTDRSGPPDYNLTLSQMRADSVLDVLGGHRAAWVDIALQKNKVKDRKRILKWVHTTFGWPCDPGTINDSNDQKTKDAVKAFQTRYNVEFKKSISEDGIVGEQTWGAFFDVYMLGLKQLQETDDAGLEAMRKRLKFLNGGQKNVGCGENHPITAKTAANYRSPVDRRVEILFFDPGEEPKMECHPSLGTCVPDKCEIYHRKIFDLTPLPVTPAPPPLVLTLTSPGIDAAKKTSHGAPVALNDDHDNGKFYPAAAPAGHRELEPIFDLDHLEETPAEDDLLEIEVGLNRAGRPGSVRLEALDGAANVRLWPKKTKGAAGDVIALPADLPAGNLPKKLFVEGIATGKTTLQVSHALGAATLKDKLVINVVELRESQGGTRKVIYDYNSDIDFEVVGAPANYTFEWDLDGNGNFKTAVFETGQTTARAKVKYGPAESATTVRLVQNASNTRQVYDVAVRLTGGLVLHVKGTTIVGGVKTPGMRVALNTNQGQALPAQSNAGLQGLFPWSDTVPVTFSEATAAELASHQTNDGVANAFSGADRIQLGTLLTDSNAITSRPGVGAARRVYGVVVGTPIFTSGQVREDLVGTVNHEIKHLQQHVQVRDNVPANNVWRLLDNHFGGANGYGDVREAEGHWSELMDANVSWRHQIMAGQRDLLAFRGRYNACINTVLPGIPAGATFNAAKTLIQGMYRDLPFFEMKRPGYDFFVRAPQ